MQLVRESLSLSYPTVISLLDSLARTVSPMNLEP